MAGDVICFESSLVTEIFENVTILWLLYGFYEHQCNHSEDIDVTKNRKEIFQQNSNLTLPLKVS